MRARRLHRGAYPPQRYHLTLDPPLWCALSEKWPFDITSIVEPFIKEKQWQEAVAALDKAIKLVPTAAPRLGAQLDAIIKGERENIAAAALAGRHADALRMVEEIAGLVERPEVASDGKAGPATAMQLGNVAWHALFTAAHERALAAADRALELTPDRLWIVTNRAHALLFLGRVEKAKAVYLTHKGRKVPESNDAAWEQVITDDFAQLRKAGLAHSAMVEIEGVLTK
jgi:tetratricopeptide (TPR) repeat protein